MKQTKRNFLSDILGEILALISKKVEIDYFKNYVGQNEAFHLLIYLTGLILCATGKTMTGIADALKLCKHDALRRMLLKVNLSRILPGFFIRWISRNRKTSGYLMIDDTVLNKQYSKVIECAGYCFDSNTKKVIMGIHLVVMYWSDGQIKIPVDWRLWIPRNKTSKYNKKTDLAREIILANGEFLRTCEYMVFDGWYCTRKILWLASYQGINCVTRSAINRKVVFKGMKLLISEIRETRFVAEIPGYGKVLVYRHEFQGEVDYLISTDLFLSPKEVKRRHDSRWKIEECFRFSKQQLGLEDCQCRKKSIVESHINLVLLAHFVTEVLSIHMSVDVYEVSKILVWKFLGLNRKFPRLKQRKEFLKHVI